MTDHATVERIIRHAESAAVVRATVAGPDSDPRDFDRNDPPVCECGETLEYEGPSSFVPEKLDPPQPAEPARGAEWHCCGCGFVWFL